MRACVALVGLGLITVAAFAFGSPAGTTASQQPDATGMKSLRGVNFVSNCRFSHRLMDDPIVYPKSPGASHDHTFVGNRTTNAYSTVRSLLAGSSTCKRVGETAAYWTPTLLLDGRPVEPSSATIYYRRRTLDPVRPFPAGLRMIGGASHSFEPQGSRVTFWNCGASAAVPPSADVPTCPAGRASALRLHVNFPSCWNGRRLDSPNHQSHMAYPMRGRCPATHAVAVPAISLIFRYPIAGGAGVSLSSGGQHSAHADFFNAWNQPVLTSLVDGCLNALRHCGRGT